MKSLRTAAHQYLGLEAPLSIRSVAGELAVPAGSALDLVERLDQQKVSSFSGSLLPSSVKGSATLELTSDGFWTFAGHVHENGFIGHQYVFAAGPNFSDADGHGFVVTQDSSVTDSRDSDFVQRGWDPRISANWDQLSRATVSFRLEVDITPGDVLKGLAGVLALAGAIVLFFNPLAADAGVRKIESGDGTSHYHRPE